MACFFNAYFSPTENTLWREEPILRLSQVRNLHHFSPRREGHTLSFAEGKSPRISTRRCPLKDKHRIGSMWGEFAPQRPSTLCEQRAIRPNIVNIYKDFVWVYVHRPRHTHTFPRRSPASAVLCKPTRCQIVCVWGAGGGGGGRDPCPLLSALGRGGGAVAFCPSFELCWEFRGVAFECKTTKKQWKAQIFRGEPMRGSRRCIRTQ